MMGQILKNHEHIQELCHDYEQGIKTNLNIGTIRFLVFDLFLYKGMMSQFLILLFKIMQINIYAMHCPIWIVT